MTREWPRHGGRLLQRWSRPETARLAELLRTETVGGGALLGATIIAIAWANSPWRHGYDELRTAHVGFAAWHLELSLQHWASDGLLAVFFLVAGLELKHELVVGELSDLAKAVLPVAAAVAGVVVPAVLFVAVSAGEPGAARGWAVPTATDIAFALAVLAVIGSSLPSALRAFLLTLAVVDDVIAIVIIAVFYTDHVSVVPLLVAAVLLAAFTALVQHRITTWWLLTPLALAVWALVNASGVHATVAGVLLGLVVPVRRRTAESASVAARLEHRLRPISAGLAVPAFALLSAGVSLGGGGGAGGGLGGALRDRVALGIVVALVLGKAIGIFGGTWLVARFTRAELDADLAWLDVLGVALLAGVGFTVSLLIGELAFGDGSARDQHVKVAVLAGSVIAAALASIVLRVRNAHYEARAQLDRDGADD